MFVREHRCLRLRNCSAATDVIFGVQETKTKFLGQPIYVAIREVSRPDRKITLNMVEATQRIAYRNLRVSGTPLAHDVANPGHSLQGRIAALYDLETPPAVSLSCIQGRNTPLPGVAAED